MLWDRKFKNFIFTVIFKVILLVLFPPFSPSLIEFIWSLGIPIFMKMVFLSHIVNNVSGFFVPFKIDSFKIHLYVTESVYVYCG